MRCVYYDPNGQDEVCGYEATVQVQADMSPMRLACAKHFMEYVGEIMVGGYATMYVESITEEV